LQDEEDDSLTTGATHNLEAVWNPNLFVENALGDQQPNSVLEVKHDADGSAFVVEKKTFEGTFSETMELRSFPFDIQVSSRYFAIGLTCPLRRNNTTLPAAMHIILWDRLNI